MSNITPARLLRQYAEATEDDYAFVPDTSRGHDLHVLTNLVQQYGEDIMPMEMVAEQRQHLLLCPYGAGHWVTRCARTHPHTEVVPEKKQRKKK